MNFFPLIEFLLKATMKTLVVYVISKQDRENFSELKSSEYSLSCFKGLIKSVFPSAILITDNSSVLFKNQEASKIFKSDKSETLLKNFQKLKILGWNENNEKNLSPPESALINTKGSRSHDLRKLLGGDTKFFLDNNITKYINDILDEAIIELDKEQGNIFYSFYAVSKNEVETGSVEFFEVNIKNIVWEKKHALMIIITENGAIQRIKALNEQALYKDRLLATVSHDLRKPLNGITGMISTVIEELSEKHMKKCLELAYRSSKLLLFMINDFLDHSQITNGKLRLNLEVFSILSLIQDISKLIKFQAKQKGLILNIENKLPVNDEFVKNDPNRLKQIIINLLGNAVKFTQKGFVKISVERNHNILAPAKAFLLKVEDSGIGIKKENQKKLFQLYGKIDENSEEKINPNGIGLGLAISQSLLMLMNSNNEESKIKVESEYGKGSCFYFTLISAEEEIPIGSANFGEQEELALEDKQGDFIIRRLPVGCTKYSKDLALKKILNVLIVDDDQINIMVAKSFLKDRLKYNCLVANNGQEAVDHVRAKASENIFFDIILMDCNMPIMTGYEATKILKDLIRCRMIPAVPIIGCTANASLKDYEYCFEMGMTDYITKPYTGEALRKKISECLEKHN